MTKYAIFLTLLLTTSAAALRLSAQTGDYHVGAGDTLDLKFFYNPELNDSMQVRPDGKISLPLVGDVAVAGHTIPEVESNLKQLYSPTLARAEVNVAVKTFASQRVFVGGEVNRPSTIPLLGDMTAQEAILDAGGPKRTGELSKVVLIRRGDNGQPVVQILDLTPPKPPANTFAALPPLRPFDVVLIPESTIGKLNRWIDMYIRQLIPINLAGGFTYLFQPIQ
jgi:polysaccharide biosynthesis/export protein